MTQTLVLRCADVGIATYVSLRVVGEPARSVTWVVEEPHMQAVEAALNPALPDPIGTETPAEAIERAVTTGAFGTVETEFDLARLLGSLRCTTDVRHSLKGLCSCLLDLPIPMSSRLMPLSSWFHLAVRRLLSLRSSAFPSPR